MIKFSNNAATTIAGSITNTSTTIVLTTGSGSLFPSLAAGEVFYATLVDSLNNIEIVKVTSRVSDTLTVVRGQDGTSPRAYSAGDRIGLRLPAVALNSFVQFDEGTADVSQSVDFLGNNSFSGTNTFSGTVNFSGAVSAPTQAPTDNDTSVATTAFVQAAITAARQALYPVGSVYINATDATNPATLLGFGTWTAFGAGRVMVGLDAGDPLFDTAEETGGSKDAVVVAHTHTTTVTDPGHAHTQAWWTSSGVGLSNGTYGTTSIATGSSTTGISVAVNSSGVSGTNANIQPYITVRMWKRTA